MVTVPWVLDKSYTDSLEILNDYLPEISLQQFSYGQEALDYLVSTVVPLVIVSPYIPPGDPYTDPEFATIMRAKDNPDNYEIGLRVIRAARGDDSLNKNTPIIAAGFYGLESDLVPRAQARALEAGATEYINLNELAPEKRLSGYGKLHSRIQFYLKL